jgi:hypothetical protein
MRVRRAKEVTGGGIPTLKLHDVLFRLLGKGTSTLAASCREISNHEKKNKNGSVRRAPRKMETYVKKIRSIMQGTNELHLRRAWQAWELLLHLGLHRRGLASFLEE